MTDSTTDAQINPILARIAAYLDLDLKQAIALQIEFDAELRGSQVRITWDGFRIIPSNVFTAIVEGRNPDSDSESES